MIRVLRRPDALRAPGRFVFVAAVVTFLAGGWSRAVATQTSPLVLSCSARPQLSAPDLSRLFGDAGTALERAWRDEARSRLKTIAITTKDAGWKTPEGIKVGMAIADLEALNLRSFLMRGFDQPDAGMVLSWTGGRLESKDDDGCRIVVRLAPTVHEFTTLEYRLVEAIAGTPEVSSDDRRIKPMKAAVTMIGLEWRD